MTAYLRSRAYAAAQHVANGMKLRDDLKLQEALTEFQRAVEIDSTNFVAAQEVRRTAAMLKKQNEPGAALAPKPESPLAILAAEAEGPVDLEPNPNNPITLRMTTTLDNVYRTIGKLGGINVLFDLDYKPQRITIELNEVMLREALAMVALQSKTFWLCQDQLVGCAPQRNGAVRRIHLNSVNLKSCDPNVRNPRILRGAHRSLGQQL